MSTKATKKRHARKSRAGAANTDWQAQRPVKVRIEGDVYEVAPRSMGDVMAYLKAAEAIQKAVGAGEYLLSFSTALELVKRMLQPEVPPERVDAIATVGELTRVAVEEIPKVFRGAIGPVRKPPFPLTRA